MADELGAPASEGLSYGITFTKYIRVVLPLDGFVFWVKAQKVSPGALYAMMKYNGLPFNKSEQLVGAPDEIHIKGSIHYATTMDQDEEETYTTNAITLNAEKQVVELNSIDPNMVYMTTYRGIRYFFSSTDNFFERAGIWHYHGHAVYADMASQVIDDPRLFYSRQIVSNSLPFWLTFNDYANAPWEPFVNPVKLYPSYLVPLNIVPPFAAVHIENTEAIGNPLYDKTFGRTQLVKELVRVTTFGLSNDLIEDFIDFVLMWVQNHPDLMGISNHPVARDEKRAQVELQAISQKKVVDFEVNYYQSRARNIAQQSINQVLTTYMPADIEPFQNVSVLINP